eukprot:snap_masked-scaffold_4-processed-gene-6.4-mRNA-1 protein AED:1.00 eAED:1.00 QI:0/-1/0/0/-1/1/1/0/62
MSFIDLNTENLWFRLYYSLYKERDERNLYYICRAEFSKNGRWRYFSLFTEDEMASGKQTLNK